MIRTRLGILLTHLSERTDLQRFISELKSINKEIIILIHSKDELIAKNLGVQYFILNLNERRTFNVRPNFLLKFLKLKSKLRHERFNYKIRKVGANSRLVFFIKKSLRLIDAYLPGLITYDFYLKIIKNQNLPKIDRLLVFSIVNDHNVISTYLSHNIPTDFYLYSWDHPIKEIAFSSRYNNIYVWNKGLKQDLVLFHDLRPEKIKVVGSTQLTYIKSLLERDLEFEKFPQFIYIIFTTGRSELILQELDFIENLARNINNNNPEIEIVVRKYPNTPQEMLQTIRKRITKCGAKFDEDFVETYLKLNSSNEVKFLLLKTSKMIIHMGTTVGIESMLLNKNVVFYTFLEDNFESQKKLPKSLLIHNCIINQHHIQKYFISFGENKIANSITDCLNYLNQIDSTIRTNSITHGIQLLSNEQIIEKMYSNECINSL